MIARLFRMKPCLTNEEQNFCVGAFLDYALLIEFRNESGVLSDDKADRLSEKLSEWRRRLL